jgi:hypothetical protein
MRPSVKQPIWKDKNVMARTRKYYLKNHYLTLRSKVHKGHYGTRQTALWSCTHIPNIIDLSRKTKCYGPDKKILFKKQSFDLEVKGQGPTKVIMVCYTPPYGHALTYQISLTYLERQKCYGPDKKILFKKTIIYLTLRSKSHEGHYGMRHTALLSCTHTPNIIDLSGKTKKLWSGQALPRRSRRSGRN